MFLITETAIHSKSTIRCLVVYPLMCLMFIYSIVLNLSYYIFPTIASGQWTSGRYFPLILFTGNNRVIYG